MVANYDVIYWCVVPMMTFIIRRKLRKKVADDYEALLDLLDMDDAMFQAFDRLRFKKDDDNLRLVTRIPRGKVCPDATDKETVELDAMVFFNEMLADVQSQMLAYDFASNWGVTCSYVPGTDWVVYSIYPLAKDDLDQIDSCILVNKHVTILYGIILVLALVICLMRAFA